MPGNIQRHMWASPVEITGTEVTDQIGSVDCALHAAANACAFLHGYDPSFIL